jgi:hypothetical protein
METSHFWLMSEAMFDGNSDMRVCVFGCLLPDQII